MRLAEFSRWENILNRTATGGVFAEVQNSFHRGARSPSLTEEGKKVRLCTMRVVVGADPYRVSA